MHTKFHDKELKEQKRHELLVKMSLQLGQESKVIKKSSLSNKIFHVPFVKIKKFIFAIITDYIKKILLL